MYNATYSNEYYGLPPSEYQTTFSQMISTKKTVIQLNNDMRNSNSQYPNRRINTLLNSGKISILDDPDVPVNQQEQFVRANQDLHYNLNDLLGQMESHELQRTDITNETLPDLPQQIYEAMPV